MCRFFPSPPERVWAAIQQRLNGLHITTIKQLQESVRILWEYYTLPTVFRTMVHKSISNMQRAATVNFWNCYQEA